MASGLSAEAFAKKAGANAKTLTWWRWKFQSEGVPLAVEPPRARGLQFIELEPPAPAPTGDPIELDVSGVTLRVPDRFDPDTLVRLLDVLRESR